MKSFIVAAVALGSVAMLSGCSQTEKGAAIGAVGGAAVGAAVTGSAEGAAVGGLIGGTAGALIGNANEPGKCYYRGRDGRRYIANC
ncbi:MAG: glycine zipper domain-containing protein [Rhizobiaceae bacterium]|jgi:phage tail tape-measure protein